MNPNSYPKCRKDTIKIKIAIYLSSEVLNAESDENVVNDTHTYKLKQPKPKLEYAKNDKSNSKKRKEYKWHSNERKTKTEMVKLNVSRES